MRLALREVADTAVDDDGKLRKTPLDLVNQRIVERRHIAVCLRTKPLQPRLARVDDENAAEAAAGDGFNEMKYLALVLLVNGEAMLDGNGYRAHRCLHRTHAFGDQRGVVHQAGADAVVLHAVAGAADVQIDFLIAVRQGDGAGACQRLRLAAAQLQSAGRVAVVLQMALGIAVNQRAGGHHFRVQQGAAGKKAVQRAAFWGR